MFLLWLASAMKAFCLSALAMCWPAEGRSQLDDATTLQNQQTAVGREAANGSLNFFGRIVDANSAPVAGVPATTTVNIFAKRGIETKKIERVSDADGRFSIEDQAGKSISAWITKLEGYEIYERGETTFTADQLRPEQKRPGSALDNPFVFHVAKIEPGELLYKDVFQKTDLVPDGRWYAVNFRNNSVTEGSAVGDIFIKVTRPLDSGREQFDWDFEVKAGKFKILKSNDAFMYTAPAGGYGENWAFHARVGKDDYVYQANPRFYLRSDAPETFGRVDLKLISRFKKGASIAIGARLNPSGSKNLREKIE